MDAVFICKRVYLLQQALNYLTAVMNWEPKLLTKTLKKMAKAEDRSSLL